jgi:RNA polymerase sigma-B factor
MPLVEALAHRHERRGAEHDDLVQAGSIGLLNAIERYDPKRGDEFVAFAVPTVAGEMKRHLRDRAATVRLPRRLHEASVRLPSARAALSARLGRPPTVGELAAEIDIGPDELAQLETKIARVADEAADESGERDLDASEARVALSGAFRTLDDTDRRILYLRFVEERSRRDVASELGMSQGALARRADAALAKLRTELEGRAFDEAQPASRSDPARTIAPRRTPLWSRPVAATAAGSCSACPSRSTQSSQSRPSARR